jgi:glycosyltransferase involved in cell wall biosynthesis
MKLSACIIAKNESALLERCLKSLEGVDEIIVCDTGSTDNTVKIAEKYTKKVYTDYQWADNFAEARNYALSKVDNDEYTPEDKHYILSIDADEILQTPISEIKKQLENIGGYNALSVVLRWDKAHSHKVPRIFKVGLTWQGKIHEYVTCNAKPSDIVFKYDKSPAHELDPDRNLRILLSDTDNPRSQFYLANEYYDRGQIDKALEWYLEYLKHGTWRYEIADANLRVARCLWSLQRGDEARDYCLQAILGNPNFKEALLLMAEMSWEKEAAAWRRYAETATNEDVIFIR